MIATVTDAHGTEKYMPATQRGRDRREKILAAAEAVFFEMGFEGASVSEIVRRSGGSLATLYKMFGTKEELFKSLVVANTQSLFKSLSIDRLSSLPPAEVLAQIGKNFTDICATQRGRAIFLIVMSEGARFPGLRDIFLNSAVKVVQRDLARYFEHQVKLGTLVLDDSLIAAKIFLEMVKGDIPLRASCGEQVPSRRIIERQVQAAVNLFLRGAQPR